LIGADEDRRVGVGFGQRKLAAGQVLYREGDAFHFIYAVRSGTFKSGLRLAGARDQVCAFHTGGEVIGLDGVESRTHATTATALEDTQVCAIAYDSLVELAAGDAALQHRVGQLMSREIVRGQSLMLLLGSMDAQHRLAVFLLDMSRHFRARGYSAHEFNLRMTRADISSYLGLRIETVSRTFAAFQQRRWLEVDRRHIRFTDLEAFARAFEGPMANKRTATI
jgi:CRP/FNR family transcriptional regulator